VGIPDLIFLPWESKKQENQKGDGRTYDLKGGRARGVEGHVEADTDSFALSRIFCKRNE